MKFHENLSSGCRVIPLGQMNGRTGGHSVANNIFSKFCERALNTRNNVLNMEGYVLHVL
jgi:hypothetical protein